MVKQILNEKKISIPEVKEILDKVYKHMEKLGDEIVPDPFTEATYEYVHNFSKMDAKTARNIINMLLKEYNMDESYAIQIVNIDPNYPQEVKIILEKDPVLRDMTEEEIEIMIQNIRDLQS